MMWVPKCSNNRLGTQNRFGKPIIEGGKSRKGQLGSSSWKEQGDSVVGGEQESGMALGMGQQLGGGTPTATIGVGVTAKYDQPLHASITEVTVVPENQDCK
jgi:hypothetical protein